MIRRIALLLFIGLAWGQTTNPCDDERYLKVKEKSLDEMSDREYAYFLKFDEKCTDYLESSSTYSRVKTKESVVKPIDGSTFVQKGGLYYAPDLDKPYSGEAVWYWGNGQKNKEGTYKDGKKDGNWKEWSRNGEIVGEGNFSNGTGKWTGWYENGQKKKEGTFKDGQPDGQYFIYWNEDGSVKEEYHDY